MAKRHPPHEEHVDESWLIPYADILTLLLALFIVLFASSNVDEAKYEAVMGALQEVFGGAVAAVAPGGGDGAALEDIMSGLTPEALGGGEELIREAFEQLYEDMLSIIEDNEYTEYIELVKQDGLIILRFRDSVLFYPDRATFIPAGLTILEKLSHIVTNLEHAIEAISIEGHSANPSDTGLDQNASTFSWELSNNRALAVLQHFSHNAGFPERKMSCVGRSHFSPIDENDLARNRRVEIRITRLAPTPPAEQPAQEGQEGNPSEGQVEQGGQGEQEGQAEGATSDEAKQSGHSGGSSH